MATGAPAAEASTVARRNPVSQSAIRLYAVPVVLFTLGLFFQLVVLPSSFTTSHYEGERVKKKYAGLDIPMAANFIKIRYAFELLTNPLLKRDYDIFGVDEQLHIIETVKKQYDGKQFAQVPIPLLNVSFSDSMEKAEGKLTSEDFFSSVGKNETWLTQQEATAVQTFLKPGKEFVSTLKICDQQYFLQNQFNEGPLL
ncbi:unnamed protein product [Spirodela intermedia]|uniref:Uncharacterized protein n=1 Tax=Spirodela intermedia TaxID=51605 RepID=A0A7I8IPM5_SPIIN|nr:unnamed protein product [Spirodela intermedia]CAA6659731.1 unnamed protein product [Spirodela intermedia]